jgi:hypothetical protein
MQHARFQSDLFPLLGLIRIDVLNQTSILRKVESLPDFILPFWFFYLFTHETKVVTFLREMFVDVRIHVLQMDNFPYGEALDASQSLVSHRLGDDTRVAESALSVLT